VIFPFEQDYYRQRGVAAEYVGHPLADLALPQIAREEFAKQHDVNAAKPWIALLPGSRKKEVLLNLPVMLESARRLGEGYEYLVPVASTLSRDWVAQQLGDARVQLVDDARAALLHARAAVVASGTATVEAALIGTPFVVVYRVSGLSYAIGRRLVRVKTFAMPNLISGREIVPEFIQSNFTAENILREMGRLIPSGAPRAEMVRNLQDVGRMLHIQAGEPASFSQTAIARAAQAAANMATRASNRTPSEASEPLVP
jgi:lipid-A-disaccharide synthase